MKKPFVIIVIFLIVIIVIFIYLFVFNSSREQGDKFLSVPPCAFVMANTWHYNKDELTFLRDHLSLYFTNKAGDAPWAFAPVYLPDGAVVKKFLIYCTDNDNNPENELSFELGRSKHEAEESEALASIYYCSTQPSPNRIILEDDSIDYPQINNKDYSYWLYIEIENPSQDVKFHGAKIIYE